MSIYNFSLPSRLGIGTVFGLIFGMMVAWIAGAVLLEFFTTGRIGEVGWFQLPDNLMAADAKIQKRVLIMAGGLGLSVLGFALYGSLRAPTTAYGDARFATLRDLKREKYAARLGKMNETDHEIILAKIGGAKAADAFFVKTEQKPHVLVVAPTETGKTSGFAIPNLLHFDGSIVVLDMKGELFEVTSQRRLDMGDLVFNFRPDDPERSHGYNPLHEAAKLENLDKRWVEVSDVVNYLAQAQNAGMEGFVDSGKAIFTALAMLQLQRGQPFIGDVLAMISKATPDDYRAYSEEVEYPRAQAELVAASIQEPKILKSYVSVLLNSGLGLWRDPMVDKVTRRNDFDFSELRRTPHSIYFHVPTKRAPQYAPLIRMFFNHLIGSLQTKEPGKGEEFKVLVMLDEFDQIGKMPMVPEAFKTLRSFGGRLAIITQSLAGLEKIYGREEVRNILVNAGNKIFMATDDKETTEYISSTIGDQTRFQTSRSFEAKTGLSSSSSVREEGARLMRAEEISRLKDGKLIIIRTQLMPVKADKIRWFADPWFLKAQKAGAGKHAIPMPDPEAVRFANENADKAFRVLAKNVEPEPVEEMSEADKAALEKCRQEFQQIRELKEQKDESARKRGNLRQRRAQLKAVRGT